MPDSVVFIGEAAFVNTKLENFSFPEGLKVVNDYVLGGCECLQEVYLPDSVENIYAHAFADTAIKELTIPPILKQIGACFLDGNSKIERLRIESSYQGQFEKDTFAGMNPDVVVEVPKEKIKDYKKMLYTHGLPKTAKVVAY